MRNTREEWLGVGRGARGKVEPKPVSPHRPAGEPAITYTKQGGMPLGTQRRRERSKIHRRCWGQVPAEVGSQETRTPTGTRTPWEAALVTDTMQRTPPQPPPP